jgi:prophage regulatory protein
LFFGAASHDEKGNSMAEKLRQFLRLKQVKVQVGLSRSAIYEKIKTGEFPKPYPLGARAVGFLASDIDLWIESRIKAAHKPE